MANLSVYIETTVVSYLTAWMSRDLIRAAHQQITQEWWDTRRFDFELFISEFVLQEASAGDAAAAQRRMSVLAAIPLLDVNTEVERLAQNLLKQKALPVRAATDALHIAVAATHDIDFLLTWNCKHLANAEMLDLIEKACRSCGYRCPRICTPEELLGGQDDVEG